MPTSLPLIKNANKLLLKLAGDLDAERINRLDILTKVIVAQLNTQYAGGPIHTLGELERGNYTDGMVYGRIPYIEFDPPLAGPAVTLKIRSITYTGKPIQKAASNIISLVDVTLENGIQLKMTIRFTMPLQR